MALQPQRRQQVGLNLPGPSVTPAASPVDTYYRTNAIQPAQSNRALELANALAPFSKSLAQYQQFQMGALQEEAKTQAEMDIKDMSTNKLRQVVNLTAEELAELGLDKRPVAQRPDYIIAARLNAGKRLGDLAQQDIIQKFGEMQGDLTDPNKDPNIAEAIGQIREEVLSEFGEMGYYGMQGAASVVDPLIDNLTKKTIEDRQKRVEDENVENITVSASEAMTAAAADGMISSDERQVILSDIQTQLETYKATGGKKPQDILFDALERAAGSLVDDDPDGDEAAHLLDMAEAALGVGGGPLAKPGTKNHERLMVLKAAIESRAQQNRNKDRRETRERREDADRVANNIVSGFALDNPGQKMNQATRDAVREAYVDQGLDGSEANTLLLAWDDKLETRNVTKDDPEVVREFQTRLDDGEVLGEELVNSWKVSLTDTTFKYLKAQSEANQETPEMAEAQTETWAGFFTNVVGAAGIKAYTEEAQLSISNYMQFAKDAFRREARAARESGDPKEWSAFMNKWSTGGQLVDGARKHLAESLESKMVLLPSTLKQDRLVQGTQKLWLDTLPEPPEGTETQFTQVFNEVWNDYLGRAIDEVKETKGVLNAEIPGLVQQWMIEHFDEMRNTVMVSQSEAEASLNKPLQGLQGRVEDTLLGEQFTSEETRGYYFNVNEKLNDHLLTLVDRVSTPESKDYQDSQQALLEAILGDTASGVPAEKQMLFLDSVEDVLSRTIGSDQPLSLEQAITDSPLVSPRDRNRIVRAARGAYDKVFEPTANPAKTKEFLRVFMTARQLAAPTKKDYASLLIGDGGELPKGITVDDLPINQMPLFTNRSQWSEWRDEMIAVPAEDKAGVQLRKTRIGRLVEALGLPETTVDLEGNQVFTAQVLMKMQHQLLAD